MDIVSKTSMDNVLRMVFDENLASYLLRVLPGIIFKMQRKRTFEMGLLCYTVLFVLLLRPHLCQTICKPFGGFELLLGCDSVPLHT